jgi:hypothetical protein
MATCGSRPSRECGHRPSPPTVPTPPRRFSLTTRPSEPRTRASRRHVTGCLSSEGDHRAARSNSVQGQTREASQNDGESIDDPELTEAASLWSRRLFP